MIFLKLFFDVKYPNKIEKIIIKHNKHIRNINLIKFNIDKIKSIKFNELDISVLTII